MITKTATYTLKDHQRRVLSKLEKNPGVVVRHSPGSGKTLTALSAAENYIGRNPDKRALFVVPASLVTNIQKEIDKHGINLPQDAVDVLSYDKAVNRKDDLLKNNYGFVVADEAHKLRNTQTKRYKALNELISNA